MSLSDHEHAFRGCPWHVSYPSNRKLAGSKTNSAVVAEELNLRFYRALPLLVGDKNTACFSGRIGYVPIQAPTNALPLWNATTVWR
jgi:hypothetical protein